MHIANPKDAIEVASKTEAPHVMKKSGKNAIASFIAIERNAVMLAKRVSKRSLAGRLTFS